MKKLILTSLVAVFAATTANAANNRFVGGSAAFGLNDEHKSGLMIAPELGYQYNDRWSFGADVHFGYMNEKAAIANEDAEIKADTYGYGVGVFTRYKVAQFGGAKVLLKGRFGADWETYASDDENIDGEMTMGLNASIVPMVTYDISESFTLYANLNFLGVYAGYDFENKDLGRKSSWNVGGYTDSGNVANTSDFQIGFLYNF